MTDRDQLAELDARIVSRYQYFPQEEWDKRYQGVLEQLEQEGIDTFIVTSTENIFWLTGFQTTGYYFFQAFVVSREHKPFLFTRQMENVGARARTWLPRERCHYYYDTQNPIEQLAYLILEHSARANDTGDAGESGHTGSKVIGYEKDSSLFPASYEEHLKRILSGYYFQNTRIVEGLRQVKSSAEIEVLKLAAKATEEGMAYGIDSLRQCFRQNKREKIEQLVESCKENMTSEQKELLEEMSKHIPPQRGFSENDLAACIQYGVIRAGGEYPACPPFVASGERGYIGHATWEQRELQEGDVVFLEIGGCRYRYHTAMMRTVFIGGELPPIVKEAEDIINDTLTTCMREMKPDVPIYKIDSLSKRIMNNNSFGYINHVRFGYSIGCAFSPGWGEDTVLTINGREERKLQQGMVFHLIPFMMIPDIGTVGISETVQVTENGAVSLFNFPRKIFTV